MSSTMNSDQVQMLQNLLEALNAIKGSVGASTTSKTTSKKKVKDPNAPKRPLNPKIVALNEERKRVYQDMQASYFEENPSAVGMEPAEIRKLAKEGKMPPFPTYPQALKEHSRRMGEADPEHAKKSKARRDALDARQAERKKEKNSSKNSDTSSVVSASSAPAEVNAEVTTEVVKDDSPLPPAPPSAPAPAPAPATEEKKARGRPKKVKTAEAPSSKPEPIVTTTYESADSEEFNMKLTIGAESFLLNGENWVITQNQDWVGLWNPETKELDRSAPEPS